MAGCPAVASGGRGSWGPGFLVVGAGQDGGPAGVGDSGGDVDQFAAESGDGGSAAAVSAVDAGEFLQPGADGGGQQGGPHPDLVDVGVGRGQVAQGGAVL